MHPRTIEPWCCYITDMSGEDGESSEHPERPPSFQRALLAGAISGVAVDFILFPLDTVKTRIQSAQGFVKSGGFKGVYNGVGSVGIGSAPGAASFFVTYEALKSRLPKTFDTLATSPGLNHLVSASGAEFMSCLIRVPTEVIKSRTQAGTYGKGKSSLHSAIMTARNEGIRGFYRGFGITIVREIPFTSIQFPLYEGLKTQLSVQYLDGKRPTPVQAALCGMIAGGTAAALTTPLDVVKTRVMLEAQAAKGSHRPSPSVLSFPPRLVAIFRNEGIKALFGGWQPRTLAISFGGAVFLGIYDFFVHWGLPRGTIQLPDA
ncbi:putative S-adenosylmethionine transporter [Kockovaella imperatae]|uniref:Putative S-adenosylmethionine transporter n=1 Tax=Kockovaella imperatae TaxID=4999 RepID=A0A1Y1UI53_9TREE|nr:putative S-adenosylmethionine transporter [Kockovaella imperatae]ORX37728.1 putative S-adenosylmethionine transporter [Kockovaella imperatae]